MRSPIQLNLLCDDTLYPVLESSWFYLTLWEFYPLHHVFGLVLWKPSTSPSVDFSRGFLSLVGCYDIIVWSFDWAWSFFFLLAGLVESRHVKCFHFLEFSAFVELVIIHASGLIEFENSPGRCSFCRGGRSDVAIWALVFLILARRNPTEFIKHNLIQ